LPAKAVPAATERATSGSFHFDSMGGTFALDGSGCPVDKLPGCPNESPTPVETGWWPAVILVGGGRKALSRMPSELSRRFSNGRRALRPSAGGAQVGGGLGGGGALPGHRGRRRPGPLLRPGHVPLPAGRPAHGPPGGVLGRRRDRPPEAHAGLQRAAPDRLGRLR